MSSPFSLLSLVSLSSLTSAGSAGSAVKELQKIKTNKFSSDFMMSIFNNIPLHNVDQSIYSSMSDLSSFHDEPEPSVTTSTTSFTDHLYPPPHQECPLPIFVQIPMCHNTHHQISRQQTNEIKSELIKSEVENVTTSLPSTQSTSLCTQSSTVTTANICSQQQTPPTLITARPKSSIKCFKCKECPFISISQTGLDRHIDKNHHNGNQTSVFKKLKCFGCPNVFYSQNSLKVHLVKDHQMTDDEIKYLVENMVLDSENVDETLLATPIKQKIYLKNLSILKAPEFRTDEADCSGSELFNNFNDGNNYANECEQNMPAELYEDVPDDFINLIDDEFNEQNDDLMEATGAHNDFQSKIFVKDVNNLKNPNYATGSQFVFDGVQDFRCETQQINLIDTPPPIPQTNIQTSYTNQNFSSDFNNSITEMQPKKKPCKIFIKNVDILPKPIILQTSGHSFISTSPQPQPLYSGNYILPFGKQTQSTFVRNHCDSSFLPSADKSMNENRQPVQQKKIFIKNIDILKETTPTVAPVAKKNMLHLRTVDDINLMNVNEAQSLRENFQEDLPRVSSIIENSNENYNEIEDYNINNDQCLESVIEDFVTYYQNNENDRLQFPFQDVHTVNFPSNSGNISDFHLDTISIDCPTNSAINLENITDSTTSSIDEKAVNKTEQINGNNEAQLYYTNCEVTDRNSAGIYDYEKAFDEEILFVCAEEVINSCEQNRYNNGGTPDDETLSTQNDCVVLEEITEHAKDTSKNDEPAKGRIYVVSNLMKTTNDSGDGNKQPSEVAPDTNNENQMVELIESNDEDDDEHVDTDNTKLVQVFLLDDTKKVVKRKKAIGRPKGGRNNRYTLNSTTSKDNSAIKYQCTQNCAMRFSCSKVLSFHEQCHDQSRQKNGIICPKCKENNFRNFNTLHTHLWRVHSIDMELYSCESCDFKTPILSRLLNTHMKIHSDIRDYKCDTCDKAFKNAKQLKNHRALHNEVRVIRKCEFCDKLFFNKKYLRNHVKSVHEMLNEFKCIVCDNIFSSVVACRTHMLNHTNISKKFQCEKCSYSTNDGSGFRRHLKIHENTKTYECRNCPFRCIQSKQFKSHILKLHPDLANEVLFSCVKCPYVTVNRSKFDLHQLHHEFKEASTEVVCEGEVVDESDDDEVLIKFTK